MLNKLILLAHLKFNQTRIKHLCVSEEDYVKKLIDRPYEALLRANVDIGRNNIYANIFPVTKYYENLSEMCVVGTCICFYVGDNARVARGQREDFNDRIPIRSWRYGFEQRVLGSTVRDVDDFPIFDERLKNLASYSLEILDYGYEDGKMLYGQYFYELEKEKYAERKKREAEHEARIIATGWKLLNSKDFDNALEEYFSIHNPFKMDRQESFDLESKSIGVAGCDINIDRQYIHLRCLDDLDQFRGKSLSGPPFGHGSGFAHEFLRKLYNRDNDGFEWDDEFEVPTSQLNDIFSDGGNYISEAYDDEDCFALLGGNGISKKDFANSLKELWINRKSTQTYLMVHTIFGIGFNDSKIFVKEIHGVKFRLSDDENGLVCEKVGDHSSVKSDLFFIHSEEKGEIDLNDADKLVVEKFIDRYKPPPPPIEESHVDDEIPF